LSEPKVHSFIVKLRLEKALREAGPTTWHGYITHVPSGEQSYLRDLDGIAAFITPYLEAEGVKTGLRRRVWRRVKGLKSKAK
jgi:ribosomal protein L39E